MIKCNCFFPTLSVFSHRRQLGLFTIPPAGSWGFCIFHWYLPLSAAPRTEHGSLSNRKRSWSNYTLRYFMNALNLSHSLNSFCFVVCNHHARGSPPGKALFSSPRSTVAKSHRLQTKFRQLVF